MKRLHYIILLTLITITANAQVLEGVIQNQDHEVLISALVNNISQNQHTHSNGSGAFRLENNEPGDSIEISYLGHERQLMVYSPTQSNVQIRLNKSSISIQEVVISPSVNSIKIFSDIDVQIQPVNSSQEVLRQVPGLWIGQHAGGGKAEQIFLRGFDIDHGTDIRLTVDGLPINMVSHAHGQGYADLHFIIPETIEKVNFGKGSYNTDQGNFATAGYVDFQTKNRLDQNIIKAEIGQFGTQRLMTMLSIANSEINSAYIASEYLRSDGPFESSQNFERVNVLAKYNRKISEFQQLNLLGSFFSSTWDASGQIPERAVSNGTITRFGAIDDTEGGTTRRANISLSHEIKLNDHSQISNQIFFSYYDFLLFSNFTFFLNNPDRGDQIRQEESRNIYGLNTQYRSFHHLHKATLDLKMGIQLRADNSNDNRLARTANRSEILSTVQYGDIREDNLGTYAEASLEYGRWTINSGIRWDHFRYNYMDQLQNVYTNKSTRGSILSPKLNVLYNHTLDLQYYAKIGRGFHSNDTRVVVAQNGIDILPAAYSFDLGMIAKPTRKLLLNIALWNLYLEQEFVYVGDEGIVEPSGKSNRQGIDLSSRYQFAEWLYFNVDANYTIARAIDEPEGADHIPLAPLSTISSGIQIKHPSGIFGSLNLRYLGDRPANEDNSIIAKGYTVLDANIGYALNGLSLGIQVQNLLNTEWNETQFATESRLQDETEPVEEIHFTPGTPFFARTVIAYNF